MCKVEGGKISTLNEACDFAFLFILYRKKEMHTYLFLWESTFLGRWNTTEE